MGPNLETKIDLSFLYFTFQREENFSHKTLSKHLFLPVILGYYPGSPRDSKMKPATFHLCSARAALPARKVKAKLQWKEWWIGNLILQPDLIQILTYEMKPGSLRSGSTGHLHTSHFMFSSLTPLSLYP